MMNKFRWRFHFVLLAVFLLGLTSSARTQDDIWYHEEFAFSQLQPITADNIQEVTQLISFGRGRILDLAWSPDGTHLAVASFTGVYIHQEDDLSTESTMPGSDGILFTALTYSADGTQLIAGTQGSVYVWNTETLEIVERIDVRDVPIDSIAYHDGKIGVMFCVIQESIFDYCGYQFQIIEVQTGEVLSQVSLANDLWVSSLSPDLALLAVVNIVRDEFSLLDTTTGEILAEFTTDKDIASGEFSHDGQRIALAYTGNSRVTELDVWNVADLLSNADSLEAVTPVASYEETHETWDTTSQFVFSADDESILLIQPFSPSPRWSIETGEVIAEYEIGATPIDTLAFHPVQDRLVTSGGMLVVWDMGSDEVVARSNAYPSHYTELSFSPEADLLVASHTYSWGIDSTVWSLADDASISYTLMNPDFDFRYNAIWSAEPASDASQIVYERAEFGILEPAAYNLYRYDVQSETHQLVASRDRRFASPQINGAEEIMIVDDNLSTLEYWDMNGDVVRSVSLERAPDDAIAYRSSYMPVAYNQDQSILAGALCFTSSRQRRLCNNAEIRLWDTASGALLMRLGDSEAQRINYENGSTLSFVGDFVAAGACFERDEADQANCALEGGGVRLWNVADAYLQASAEDESVRDVTTLADPIFRVEDLNSVWLPQVAIAPQTSEDALVMALTNYSNTALYILDLDTFEAEGQIIERAMFPVFNAEGTLLATTHNGEVKLFGIPDR